MNIAYSGGGELQGGPGPSHWGVGYYLNHLGMDAALRGGSPSLVESSTSYLAT